MAENDSEQLQEGTQAQSSEEQQVLVLQSTFVKDLSFEAPNSPEIFLQEYKPKIDVQIGAKNRQLQDDAFEVILHATITAKVEEKTAYIAEADFGGVFTISGITDEVKQQVLNIFCPEQLYPFVREVISDMIARGGFPRFLMAPVNFTALYQHGMQQAAAQQAEAAKTEGNA